MNKFNTTILVLIIVVVIVGIGVVLVFNKEKNNDQPVPNESKDSQVLPSENEAEDKPEYVIDLGSDIDTSDWPIFTSKVLGFSIKYHPDGLWESSSPVIGDPTEATGPSYHIDLKRGGVDFHVRPVESFTSIDDWLIDTQSSQASVRAEESNLSINDSPTLIQVKGNRYHVLIYNQEIKGLLVINYYTDYREDTDLNNIYNAMLQTISFNKI